VQVVELGDDVVIAVSQPLDLIHVTLHALEVFSLRRNALSDLCHSIHVLVVVELEGFCLIGVEELGQRVLQHTEVEHV
jgi:hypothetical protein